MINYTQAFDNSRMAIARLRSLEQFTEDDAINIFKKALGCNGKQAKKGLGEIKGQKERRSNRPRKWFIQTSQ